MIEIKEAVVDDIWADSFWTCLQEKNRPNSEKHRVRQREREHTLK